MFFFKSGAGFTLIELVMVILLIAILAVEVLPQSTGSPMLVYYEADRVLNDIRYTQLLSMLTGQRYRWVETSSTSYQILNSSGVAQLLPSGQTTYTLRTGVSFGSFTNLPNNLLAFDSQGIPYTTSGTPGTALASTATIPFAGATAQVIQITPTTGYAELLA